MSVLYPIMLIVFAILLSLPVSKLMFWALNNEIRPNKIKRILDKYLVKYLGNNIFEDQDWKSYCLSLLIFNVIMFALVYIILTLQQHLPLNPDGKGRLEPSLIFHTVASFTSNTNQQHYVGEVTMSYFSQINLMWLQFISAATGISALAALARGLSGKLNLGNFYRDIINTTFLILLPLAFTLAIILVICGVPMTFHGSAITHTLEGGLQTIARGPAAAFSAIKQLGTNGGGFFGANSAHPFENPSLVSNFIECLAIILLPMACVWMFGKITKRKRHATVIFCVMLSLLICNLGLATYFENKPAAVLQGLPIEKTSNLEGKELRLGFSSSPSWGVLTTSTSNGSVNSMHDSYNPLAGLILLIGMWLNVAFGGVGVGMINMFLYIIIGVFICGMMVGRTPEYCNRKVETKEMKLALIAILVHPFLILGGTALFTLTNWGTTTVSNPGAHGFSQILYEFSSAAANNGSGFEGLKDNTIPWNMVTGLVMILGRYLPIILPLAIVGSLVTKKSVPESTGTLHTDSVLFGIVILGSVLFIGALLFLPVAVLGPITEYLAACG
jgi:potassium-transporting ATPase potassium-binding subunit